MVVDALKAVAEKKKLTIVCVIHQPRYEIFSKSGLQIAPSFFFFTLICLPSQNIDRNNFLILIFDESRNRSSETIFRV